MSGFKIIRDGKEYRVPAVVEAAQEHATIVDGKITKQPDDVIGRWIADPAAVEAECAAAEGDRIAAEKANAAAAQAADTVDDEE
jgi:hypothetical protein